MVMCPRPTRLLCSIPLAISRSLSTAQRPASCFSQKIRRPIPILILPYSLRIKIWAFPRGVSEIKLRCKILHALGRATKGCRFLSRRFYNFIPIVNFYTAAQKNPFGPFVSLTQIQDPAQRTHNTDFNITVQFED